MKNKRAFATIFAFIIIGAVAFPCRQACAVFMSGNGGMTADTARSIAEQHKREMADYQARKEAESRRIREESRILLDKLEQQKKASAAQAPSIINIQVFIVLFILLAIGCALYLFSRRNNK